MKRTGLIRMLPGAALLPLALVFAATVASAAAAGGAPQRAAQPPVDVLDKKHAEAVHLTRLIVLHRGW